MTRPSFFGGDPTKSHYSASVRYKKPGETELEATRRRREQYDALKAAGWQKKYFQYKNGDAVAKRRQKAECERHAAEWTAKTGIALEVNEGCFL